jgi:NADH-quinone oxidoreductase subunit L
MTIPLVVLAVLSLVGGFIGLPHGLFWGDSIGHYLEPSLAALPHVRHPSTNTLVFLIAVASGVGLAGIGLDYLMYGRQSDLADRIAARFGALYRLLWNKYYVDELYDALFIQPYVRLSRYFWQTVDAGLIDGAVNGVGDLVRVVGGRARRLQTGNVQTYALAMLIGALLVVAVLVV